MGLRHSIALLLASVLALRYNPPLGFMACFVFIGLGLTAINWRLELSFEHRMYVPLAGVIGLIVFGVHWMLQRLGSRRSWPQWAPTGRAPASPPPRVT